MGTLTSDKKPTPRHRGLLITLFFIFLPTLALSLVIGEIALRIWWGDKPINFAKFGRDKWFNRYVKLNKLGFRGKLYTLEKPKGTIRIIVLGDSHTFGQGINYEENRYPDLLEKMLRKRFSVPIEMINLGISGADTVNEYITLKEKGLGFSPDIVILQYCYDDPTNGQNKDFFEKIIKMPYWARFLERRSFLFGLASLYISAPKLKEVSNEHWESISAPDAANIPQFREALTGISILSKEAGADEVAIIFPIMAYFNEEPFPFQSSDNLIKSELTSLKIPFVNLYPLLKQKGYEGRELWASPLDAHPNEKVQDMAAEELTPILESIIKKRMQKDRAGIR